MKIAMYYPWISAKGGAEHTLLKISKDKNNSFTIFTNRYDRDSTFSEYESVRIIELTRIPKRSNFLQTLVGTIIILLQKINLSEFDVFIVHTEGLADLITFRNNQIPLFLLCYTPLRPAYDKTHLKEIFSRKKTFERLFYKLFLIIYRPINKYLWKKFKNIIFISNESCKRAVSSNIIASNTNYKILNPGVDWGHIKPSYKFEKYFFLPGRITESKNIELAIKAFKIFRNKFDNKGQFKLVIAGFVDHKKICYLRKLSLASGNENIEIISNPTDIQYRNLYSNSYAILATAIHEEWGLTLIEGNAFGKPSICIDSGGYKESQINGQTGYLVKGNPKEVAKAMEKLASNPGLVKRMGQRSRLVSKKYSWTNFNRYLNKFIKISVDQTKHPSI